MPTRSSQRSGWRSTSPTSGSSGEGPPARLVRRRLLDPRPAGQAAGRPLPDAVNIPFFELADRVHELPPRGVPLGVVGPAELVDEVVAWLVAGGRRAFAAEAPHRAAPANASVVGRLWEPNAFLGEVLPTLRPGRALDLACGTGRDAVFLSSCGWDVTAVDVLPDALARARDLAGRCAAALWRPIRWIELDLEAGAPQFDGRFDLITVFRYLHRPLFGRFPDWLRPGGSAVCETFTTLHRERHGRPAHAAHVLEPNEFLKLLAGFDIRHHSEAWRGRAHTARAWAIWHGSQPPPQASGIAD